MGISLWIVQVLVAFAFLITGSIKATQSIDTLKKTMPWVEHTNPTVVRAVGILEILGAVGLILPATTGIWPWLTPIAELGLVSTMLGAIIIHFGFKEYSRARAPLVILLLTVFIAFWAL